MSLSNTTRSYGSVAKTFHWLTALLVFTVIPLGIISNDMAHQISDPAIQVSDGFLARTAMLFSLHKTIGVTIFFVALARILWALTQPRPGLLNADKRLESTLAATVHWLLYGSLVLVPLTGWIHHAATSGFAPIWWPFGQSLPFVPKSQDVADISAGLHIVFERVLIVSILLHVAGALKHHFFDRDLTLRRMLPGQVNAPQPSLPGHGLIPALAALGIWVLAIGAGSMLGAYGPAPAATKQMTSLEQVHSDWTVSSGSLGLTVTQLGAPVSGQFADWTADITFDPRDTPGPAGAVTVVVAIPSLTLGSVADQAMGPDYFDAQRFATARFEARIVKADTGYAAQGTLTIKDNSVPLTLPFDIQADGDTVTASGHAQVNRMSFDIGTQTRDEATLGFGVDISFDLVAHRAGGV